MLWSIDSWQNRVSADQYHLTVPRAQVSTHRHRVFLKLSADKLPVWNGHRLKFIFSNDSYKICCVYVTMALHCKDFDFKLTSDAKIQPFFLKNTGGEDLFLPWSRVGHALRPIFVLWLVKIWQVSSCVKFMQHLESCLLWQLRLTEFRVNLWCF